MTQKSLCHKMAPIYNQSLSEKIAFGSGLRVHHRCFASTKFPLGRTGKYRPQLPRLAVPWALGLGLWPRRLEGRLKSYYSRLRLRPWSLHQPWLLLSTAAFQCSVTLGKPTSLPACSWMPWHAHCLSTCPRTHPPKMKLLPLKKKDK